MARAQGRITRGTTNPNRLRRIDRWVNYTYAKTIRKAADPLFVDLGYGAYSVTTREWFDRIREVRDDIEMIGIEIDPVRVKEAQVDAQPQLSFMQGGFEVPTPRKPLIIRAFNVLRQYDEDDVRNAWKAMTSRLQDEGVLIEGTCDELGRIATWVSLLPHSDSPTTLTFACDAQHLERPSQFAERLPKILIHHNVPGKKIHAFLTDWDKAWNSAAPMGVFGARQRWHASIRHLTSAWKVKSEPSKLGSLCIDWDEVS